MLDVLFMGLTEHAIDTIILDNFFLENIFLRNPKFKKL